MKNAMNYEIGDTSADIINRLGVMTVECSIALLEHHRPQMRKVERERADITIMCLKTGRPFRASWRMK